MGWGAGGDGRGVEGSWGCITQHKNVVNNTVIILYGTDSYYTYCGDHFVIYLNI